jgi:hypothetical protein
LENPSGIKNGIVQINIHSCRKGTGSPDRFQKFYQKLRNLGLNKGCGWFKNILGARLFLY